MKRKMAFWMALTLLALTMMTAGASAPETDPVATAKSMLTEVYGYTAEEADGFTFEVTQTDTASEVVYAPKDHPGWIYRLAVMKKSGRVADGATGPFDTSFANYPGQNAVQDALRAARENGWFAKWDKEAQLAFSQKLADCQINLASDLGEGLGTGEISAAQAIDGFFRSCYGDLGQCAPAVTEWRDQVLQTYGLTLEKRKRSSAPGIRAYSTRIGTMIVACDVTVFRGETPKQLADAFSHPKLAGWSLLCGATLEFPQSTDHNARLMNTGLAAFEKDGERLLVLLGADEAGEAWTVSPVGQKALLGGRELFITFDSAENRFALEYPISDAETESFYVHAQSTAYGRDTLLKLEGYSRRNEETGEGVRIDTQAKGNEEGSWYHVTTYRAGAPAQEEFISALAPAYLEYVDAEAFPKSAEECRAWESRVLPTNVAVSCGVHLRQKTSSRSKDLGEYHHGTLMELLEVVPGDPYPWAHVRIGNTEGYMSSVYVRYPGSECSMKPLEQYPPLPVAKTKKPVALKKGTGWFAGTVAELPEGTVMHVMGTLGDWLHVMVPQGEADWLMDRNGTDGYLKAADVTMGATALKLAWRE